MDKEKFQRDPHLARLLFRTLGDGGHGNEGRMLESGEGAAGGAEISPLTVKIEQMAARIRAAVPAAGEPEAANAADILAAQLIARARDILAGAEDAFQRPEDQATLESVLHDLGRPALRVGADTIQPPSEVPGSADWQQMFASRLAKLRRTVKACGAVMVKDETSSRQAWMQGTAWLIADDMVVTNRHVMRPPNGGVQLAARRADAPTTARLRPGLTIGIDFARYATTIGDPVHWAKVLEVLFIAEEEDPVDIAILRIEPRPELGRLKLRDAGVGVYTNVYLIGHPGKLPLENLDQKTLAVFGNPDGTKRLSLGERLYTGAAIPRVMRHDCSTIGGFSGGPVLHPDEHTVIGLHYFGNPGDGNRAIVSPALRNSGAGRFF